MSTLNATNLKNPSSGSNNIVLGTDGTTALGTTKVTAITDSAGANSSTPAAIANGTAKAWVNFNGTGTPAIRASYNVSSITDNGTGDYTVNFTTALVDANYATVFGGAHDFNATNGDQGWVNLRANNGGSNPQTAASVRIWSSSKASALGTAADNVLINVAIFR